MDPARARCVVVLLLAAAWLSALRRAADPEAAVAGVVPTVMARLYPCPEVTQP
ncbi:hypothetical protein [Thiohalocapsa halophila]|jgi:hypothetical protein